MTLWLVGMMGSGKSSAGRLAAEKLEVSFFDTDEVVAERMGCSVAQMWGELGEAAFRDLEKVAVASVAGKEAVVATGGGAVLDRDSRDLMSDSGPVIWLRASPSVLAARVDSVSGRPLLADTDTEDALSRHLVERDELYERLATHRIDTDALAIDAVAGLIEEVWKS